MRRSNTDAATSVVYTNAAAAAAVSVVVSPFTPPQRAIDLHCAQPLVQPLVLLVHSDRDDTDTDDDDKDVQERMATGLPALAGHRSTLDCDFFTLPARASAQPRSSWVSDASFSYRNLPASPSDGDTLFHSDPVPSEAHAVTHTIPAHVQSLAQAHVHPHARSVMGMAADFSVGCVVTFLYLAVPFGWNTGAPNGECTNLPLFHFVAQQIWGFAAILTLLPMFSFALPGMSTRFQMLTVLLCTAVSASIGAVETVFHMHVGSVPKLFTVMYPSLCNRLVIASVSIWYTVYRLHPRWVALEWQHLFSSSRLVRPGPPANDAVGFASAAAVQTCTEQSRSRVGSAARTDPIYTADAPTMKEGIGSVCRCVPFVPRHSSYANRLSDEILFVLPPELRIQYAGPRSLLPGPEGPCSRQ